MCISQILLSCSCVPGTEVAPCSSQIQSFPLSWLFPSLGWVIPIAWMSYSQHLGKWELLCYFGVHISWRVLSAEAFQRLDFGRWDECWRQEGSNQARP